MTTSARTTPDPVALLAALSAALPAIVEEIETLVACESPSRDLAAVARSAEVVAAVGSDRLGVAPELLEIDGCTHLRWRLGSGPRRAAAARPPRHRLAAGHGRAAAGSHA